MAKLKPRKTQTDAYAHAGVNRDLADQLVTKISQFSKISTHSRNSSQLQLMQKRLKNTIGGYASLYEVAQNLCIAASTDGVGTKLKLAFEYGGHETVGQDLVAMSVNDLVCVGAAPLFFLDYFATGKLEPKIAEKVICGISKACAESGCLLVGGETAEMPGFYEKHEYDLAGFAVGQVATSKILPKKNIKEGLTLIALSSSGFHSNGFSLVRKVFEGWKASKSEKAKWAKRLLTPTVLYSQAVTALLKKDFLEGAAHITGSGFLNVPRISTQVSYDIDLPSISHWPKIYQWFDQVHEKVLGQKLSLFELAQTFNCGIGMVLAVEPKNAQKVLKLLKAHSINAQIVGKTIKKESGLKKHECLVTLRTPQEGAILFYD